MVGHPSSAYMSSIFERLFCEAGYFEDLPHLVSTITASHFCVCVLLVQLGQHTVSSGGEGTFDTKKLNSMWIFFDAHCLLCSILVLPEADMSHCYIRKEPVIKTS